MYGFSMFNTQQLALNTLKCVFHIKKNCYYMAYSIFTMHHIIFTHPMSIAQGVGGGGGQSNELREWVCPT